eukprot:363643-Chlamydomonas_euryale.AAC.10
MATFHTEIHRGKSYRRSTKSILFVFKRTQTYKLCHAALPRPRALAHVATPFMKVCAEAVERPCGCAEAVDLAVVIMPNFGKAFAVSDLDFTYVWLRLLCMPFTH